MPERYTQAVLLSPPRGCSRPCRDQNFEFYVEGFRMRDFRVRNAIGCGANTPLPRMKTSS